MSYRLVYLALAGYLACTIAVTLLLAALGGLL